MVICSIGELTEMAIRSTSCMTAEASIDTLIDLASDTAEAFGGSINAPNDSVASAISCYETALREVSEHLPLLVLRFDGQAVKSLVGSIRKLQWLFNVRTSANQLAAGHAVEVLEACAIAALSASDLPQQSGASIRKELRELLVELALDSAIHTGYFRNAGIRSAFEECISTMWMIAVHGALHNSPQVTRDFVHSLVAFSPLHESIIDEEYRQIQAGHLFLEEEGHTRTTWKLYVDLLATAKS
jgi:hypothetical protein